MGLPTGSTQGDIMAQTAGPATGETLETSSLTVACDGGGGPLGHPQVFLTIKPEVGSIVCPYCSRHYVATAQARAGGGH